jgi:hypothetical protein
MTRLFDWLAPIWGTLALQPFAYAWCVHTSTPYLASLGPFTILSTIYLMPMYALYWKIIGGITDEKSV